MSNPLFNALGGNKSNNNFLAMIQQFNQFRQMFHGDPRAEVQRLLDSGQMTQQQYNQLAETAKMFQQFLGK